MQGHQRFTCNYLNISRNGAISQTSDHAQDLPFYKLLECLERERKWSEKDVLLRLHVPRTTYRSWRDGTSEPSKRIYWIKLSDAFGVPVEGLIRTDLSIIAGLRR